MMNLYFSPLSLKKLVCNKYIMNPSNSWLTISLFLTFLAYMFSEPISLKYHCTFSLYKVTDLSISDSLYPSKGTFCKYNYQPPGLYQATRHLG